MGQFAHYRRSCSKLPARAGRGAFTLIELLVVVAIIALLASIMLPILSKCQRLGQRAQCTASLHTLGTAAEMYQHDYGPYIPICWRNTPDTYARPWKSWRVMLLPYVPGVSAFNCPAGKDTEPLGEVFHSVEELTGHDRGDTVNAGSYGIMHQQTLPTCRTLNFYGEWTVGNPTWSSVYPTEPGDAWTDPINSVYLADSCMTKSPIKYPTAAYQNYGTSAIFLPNDPSMLAGISFDYFTSDVSRRFADRHIGTNCLFLDGRVKNYATIELDSMIAGDPRCVWDVK